MHSFAIARHASLVAVTIVCGCSSGNGGCTNDCRRVAHNAVLARQVAADTGLPICDGADISQTSSQLHDPIMPGYEVQLIVDSYCPSQEAAEWRRRTSTSGRAQFVSASGAHVTIFPMAYGGYAVAVWRIWAPVGPKPVGSASPNAI